jgi:hypothetical protein
VGQRCGAGFFSAGQAAIQIGLNAPQFCEFRIDLSSYTGNQCHGVFQFALGVAEQQEAFLQLNDACGDIAFQILVHDRILIATLELAYNAGGEKVLRMKKPRLMRAFSCACRRPACYNTTNQDGRLPSFACPFGLSFLLS